MYRGCSYEYCQVLYARQFGQGRIIFNPFTVSVRDSIQLEALLRKIYQLLSSGEGQGSKQLANFLIPCGHWLLVLL